MSYEALALLLMILGFALILAEVFIPSGGMILVLCVISFAASTWFAYKAWWGTTQGIFWIYVGSLLVLIPGAVVGAFRLLERTSMGDHLLLSAPRREEVVPYQNEVSRLSELVGKRGTALTMMAPGGMVSVAGERLHAVSEGMVIAPGETVQIISVRGTRVVVSTLNDERLISEESARRRDAEAKRSENTEGEPPLDFDFPQG